MNSNITEKELKFMLFAALAADDIVLIDKLKHNVTARTQLDRVRLVTMRSLSELEPELKGLIRFYGE